MAHRTYSIPSLANTYLGTAPSGAGSSLLLSHTEILDDAQIKALPTTSVQIIQAPAADKAIYPIFTVILADASAGAYTNIATNPVSIFVIGWAAAAESALDSYGVVLRNAALLTAAEKQVGYGTVNSVISDDWGIVQIDELYSRIVGRPLLFGIDNDGDDLTGGNAANTVRVTVYYVVL